MKLIHLTDLDNKQMITNKKPVRLKFASGMAMSQYLHTVSMFCSERGNNKSRIVWDSEHHEIVLWFEEEKYRTYFLLMKETKGA